MFKGFHPAKSPLFEFYAPVGSIWRGIVSIPHSGETIPPEFLPYLSGNVRAYQEDVDYKVHELVDIDDLRQAGIAVIVANVHRICVDLNRAPDQSVMFWKMNTQGIPLVTSPLSTSDEAQFIHTYHAPYFEVLTAMIRELEKMKKSPVSFVDLHSMPSKPTEYHFKQNPNQKMSRMDFCVSDRKGKTCTPDFIQYFSDQLARKNSVAINDPYVGGFVTEFVDRFRTNNIQIEINRGIYMDEVSRTLLPEKVAKLKPHLTQSLIRGFEKFDS